MPDRGTGNRPLVSLQEAARYLSLPPAAVSALVDGGYLQPSPGPDEPMFPLVDLKAFLARNADNGAGNMFPADEEADPQALLEALDGRSEEMARRAFDIFSTVFPEARNWSLRRQARFIDQARGRFEAILAVTGQGAAVDEALVDDLREVGGAAAWDGSPLPQLLVILRISRDLVVQTAVELAEEKGRHWGLALSLLLTRVLPAIDRLTDALAQGYWAAMLTREEETRARYEHVVEHSSDGVFEVDVDGRVQYANPSLCAIVGRDAESIAGEALDDVLIPADGGESLGDLVSNADGEREPVRLAVRRADGEVRFVEVRMTARRDEGELVGCQGVVRDVTSAHEVELARHEFLALVTGELRTPASAIAELARRLEDADGREDLVRAAAAIREQAESMARLAEDVLDVSGLDSSAVEVDVAPLDLAAVVRAAVDHAGASAPVEVRVPDGIPVVADASRLEQVLANLVENGLRHGRPPVVVALESVDRGALELSVTDHGTGVPPEVVPTLFSRVQTLRRPERDRTAGTGLGLALVRGLVEAMGGRVWYRAAPHGGAGFVLSLPVPRRRREDEPLTV